MAQDLCKYYKKQRYVSYNNGITWQPLEEYERGELYEAHSPSCGGGDFQYRWVLVEGAYICDNKDRYTKEVQQYSEDGTVWYNVFPTTYRKASLVEVNSPYCNNGGSGQYTSGDTEPISGDTPSCPQGFIWNGNECECNGPVNASGKCEPCPDNFLYNKTTHECECQGHLDNNGNCIICKKYEYWDDVSKTCKCAGNIDEYGNCLSCQAHSHWDEQQQQCVCDRWWSMENGVCIYVDPLKTIKCDESDTVLSQDEVGYYESGWTLMSYVIGDCITEIGNNAFNGQTIMTSVTISSSVTSVQRLAFANCQSLTSLTFPSNITYLWDSAFKDCIRLEVVNFNGTIPSVISPNLFNGCYSLQSASWLGYNNITSIGDGAFMSCSSLENVSFPNTLSGIGNNAFTYCESISSITIPSGVTSIGYNAFKNCTSLTSVTINANDISIGEYAFANCQNLTSVTVNSSAVTMGSNVFEGCDRLIKITFTAPTPFEIEDGFFDKTNECALFVPCESMQAYKTAWSQYEDRISCVDTGVYYRWVDDYGYYCDGTDEYTRQKQQSTTNGITWTDTGVYRPIDFITHYSDACGYQGEVVLTVTNADGFTRYYEPCDSEPPQPSQNSKIFATYAYGNTDEKLCDGSTVLSRNDTYNMSGSTYSSVNMQSAVIGDCVTSIGQSAFESYYMLESVDISSSVTSIANYAFEYCSGLTSINLPSGLTSIGNYAFSSCSGLTSINLPSGLTSIGNYAFNFCVSLTSITIPNGITTIGENAFGWCNGLTSVTIPGSVTRINSGAFWYCRELSSVTIGSGITTISASTFGGCVKLESLTVLATTPPTLGASALADTLIDIGNGVIFVPASSVDAYKAKTRWSAYASKIQPIPNN